MGLLPEDAQYLVERAIVHEVIEENGMTCLLLPKWQLPSGLDQAEADVLIRFAPGYPDIAPDMWWMDPPMHTASGATIPGTEASEVHLGRQWQRWSRHFTAGQWQPGIDRLESYISLIVNEFRRVAERSAA